MKEKYWIEGYGSFEFRPWEDLKGRDVRYICTDYEEDDDGIDLYEIIDPKAPDFGECYTTKLAAAYTEYDLAIQAAWNEVIDGVAPY